jgi:hypothetical protein
MPRRFGLAALAVILLTSSLALAAESAILTVPDFVGGLSPLAAFNHRGFFDAARRCLEQFPFAKYPAGAAVRQKSCLAEWMKQNGARQQAITFMRLPPVPATIAEVRDYGPVDVIHDAMMWADASDGWALVGASGEMIALWNPPRLDSDAKYLKFKMLHPDVIVWTDSLTWPQMQHLPTGGTELLFGFSLKTCHACARLGTAKVAYQFDHKGRFTGSQLIQIVTSPPPS